MKRKGISLIVLVITIIIILILAGAVILSLSNNNPIENANKAVIMQDMDTFKSELSLSIANKVSNQELHSTSEVNAAGDEIYTYIPSMQGRKVNGLNYSDILVVSNGVLMKNSAATIPEATETLINQALNGASAAVTPSTPAVKTTFTSSDFAAMTAAEKYANYMGKTVTNYESSNGWDQWQIFYADENNIWLISKGYVPVSYLGDSHGFAIGTNTTYNIKGTSRDNLLGCLRNASTFNRFLDSADENGNRNRKAYSARVPTIDDFCKSYNSVSGSHAGTTRNNVAVVQNVYWSDNGVNGGYNVSTSEPVANDSSSSGYGLPQDELNSLWVINSSKPDDTYSWWLASPSSSDAGYVLNVTGSGFTDGATFGNVGVRSSPYSYS